MKSRTILAAGILTIVLGGMSAIALQQTTAQRRTAAETPVEAPRKCWRVVPAGGVPGKAAGQFLIYNVYTGESYITDNNLKEWEPLPFPKNGSPSLPFSER